MTLVVCLRLVRTRRDTIGDKIVMLKCHKHQLPFVGDPKQYSKIASMIEAEIGAFAYFIDNYEIPAEIKQGDSRFLRLR